MVGVIDPRPSSKDSSQTQSSSVAMDWLASFAPIQIKRPSQGRFSPKTDERCVTWLSQTVRGRAEGQDPFCRTLCIRRVFEHEVKSIISQHHIRDKRSSVNPPSTQIYDLNYPLPAEGQPSTAVIDGIVGGPDADGRPSAKDVRFWEAGWYIWTTKSRWATHEKMDLMMLDLDRQTGWMRAKEREERAWFEGEVQRVREHVRHANSDDYDEHNPVTGAQAQHGPLRHPYPNIATESYLVKMPSTLPSPDVYLRHIFSPTNNLYHIVKESIDSGAQKDLMIRMWETTRSGAPFVLAKNVVKRCWDAFTKDPGASGNMN